MDIFTEGREIHKGYRLKLKCISNTFSSGSTDSSECYRLIIFESGSGIAQINSKKCIFVAPSLFCLNETESIGLEHGDNVSTHSVYFHPEIINNLFSFNNVVKEPSQFKGTDFDDIYWLRPFITRTPSYIGNLSIAPHLIKRVSDLYNFIKLELEEQRDNDWPCRSRSFFFELILALQQVFQNQDTVKGSNIISRGNSDIHQVILYLHTNYHKKITIGQLSKKFNINRTTLEEQFNEVTGLPIISYLIKLRIELASMILRDTLLPISEIIERTGFNDRTHFNRLFKKLKGLTPGEYRETYCFMK